MKRKLIAILFAIALFAIRAYSQPDNEAMNIIHSKAVTINSIDSENTDYSDLEN